VLSTITNNKIKLSCVWYSCCCINYYQDPAWNKSRQSRRRAKDSRLIISKGETDKQIERERERERKRRSRER